MNLNSFEQLLSANLKLYERSRGLVVELILEVSSITGIIDEHKKLEINKPSLQRFQENQE